MKRLGKKKWRKHVDKIVTEFVRRIHVDDVVLGGGQVKELKKLPERCREGSNANAFIGGFRLWEEASAERKPRAKAMKLLSREQRKAA